MIRNFYKVEPVFEHSHDGDGKVYAAKIFSETEFSTKLQFLFYTVLPPGTSIGAHKHGNDEELYIILEGTGEMEVNSVKTTVVAGDVIVNKPFETHGLRNTSEIEDLKILVFEVAV